MAGALGPMLSRSQGAQARRYIETVLDARHTAGDRAISYLEHPTQNGSSGHGCDWHPSLATHAAMAALLTAELRRLLGW